MVRQAEVKIGCLKRRISDAIYHYLFADALQTQWGQVGRWGRLRRSARPTQPRWSTLRSSHKLDPTERVVTPRLAPLDNREVPFGAVWRGYRSGQARQYAAHDLRAGARSVA